MEEFKTYFLKNKLGITDEFGVIFSFIDFGNVNNWFNSEKEIRISLMKLKEFASIFSTRVRFYHGTNQKNKSFSYLVRKIFGKRNFITKELQFIKFFSEENNKKELIYKANFDVEIAVDAVSMIDHYETFCIFSGDSDFKYLNDYLKLKGKKVILIKSGFITKSLNDSADLVISASEIKDYIVDKKQQSAC